VIKVLQGEGPTVADLLGQTAQLTNFLADRDQLFAAVFDNLTPVLVDLAGQGEELRDTVQDLSEFMEGLAEEREDFGQSIQSMSKTLDTSEQLVKDVRAPLASNVQKTKALLEMYAAEKERFGDSIVGMSGVMDTLGRVMSYRNALTNYFCALDLSLGPVALETSTLPLEYSAVCL
jgi:phospholipid/cholesterol/gamma-HCH transport system substrate-binding protein